MKSRFRKLAVESLEARSMLSTTAFADFNNDGLLDKAVVTNPTTITVSLGKLDGSYTVSAILTTPKNRPASEIYVSDYNGDGKLDIHAVGGSNGGSLIAQQWLGNGDGTFGSRTTDTFRWGHVGHGGTW
jgi:FG-GAP-like repeat